MLLLLRTDTRCIMLGAGRIARIVSGTEWNWSFERKIKARGVEAGFFGRRVQADTAGGDDDREEGGSLPVEAAWRAAR